MPSLCNAELNPEFVMRARQVPNQLSYIPNPNHSVLSKHKYLCRLISLQLPYSLHSIYSLPFDHENSIDIDIRKWSILFLPQFT